MGEPPADTLTFLLSDGQQVELDADTLVVWLDETGDEGLSDPGHPVFGLGGCATLVTDYRTTIQVPWHRMKQDHFGGAEVPLHAAKRGLTQGQVEALAGFFRASSCHRLAVIVADKRLVESDYRPYNIVLDQLMVTVLDLAFPGGRQVAGRIVLIFEDSERGRPLAGHHVPPAIVRAQSRFLAERSLRMWRWPIPTQAGFMPKKVAAGLEVADFIVQPAGAQARLPVGRLKDRPRRDFAVVFQGAAAEGGLSHFMMLGSSEGGGSDPNSAANERDT